MINFKEWIHKENSKYIISIILGLGLAALFRKACKNGACIHFESPPMKDLTGGNVYKYGNECYDYKVSTQKCNSDKKTVELSNGLRNMI
jgi:hypothetical protein